MRFKACCSIAPAATSNTSSTARSRRWPALTSLTFEMLRWSCALRDYQLAEMTTVQFELKYGLSALGWAEMEAKLERIAKVKK